MLDKPLVHETETFLNTFGKALEDGKIDAATNMFLDDCYWRDLIAFTWNIKTVEGKDQVRDMLEKQLDSTGPSNWRIAEGEIPTKEGDVVTAWIQFDTERARCFGLIRLKGGKIWTLLLRRRALIHVQSRKASVWAGTSTDTDQATSTGPGASCSRPLHYSKTSGQAKLRFTCGLVLIDCFTSTYARGRWKSMAGSITHC